MLSFTHFLVRSGAGPSLVPCFFKVFLLAGFATFRALQGFSSLGNFRDQKLDRSDRLPNLADGDSLGRVVGVSYTDKFEQTKNNQLLLLVLLLVLLVLLVLLLLLLFFLIFLIFLFEQSWLRQIHRPVGVELSLGFDGPVFHKSE